MKQVKDYKKNLTGAACNTFVLGVLVIVQLNQKGTMSDFAVIAFTALLVSVIYLWMRGTKQYIDHRLQELEKGKQEA